jgi:hypothetical protein
MKAKITALIVLAALLSSATALYAESEPGDVRPYIGVMLDTAPLPDLLVKHLGLSPNQGIRIVNVYNGSPADKAGLERDDIIIGFQGEDVDDNERFINEVRKAGVGTEVSLEIIHLGERKTVKLRLEHLKGDFDWKYPPEPEIVQSWRPGKIFRLRPGDENWIEILKDGLEADIKKEFKNFVLHTYHHSNGDSYTITIKGNPDDEGSMITVRIGDTEYKTTIKEIDKLPEEYREPAEEALKNARKASKKERFDTTITFTQPFKQMIRDGKYHFENLNPQHFSLPEFDPRGEMFEKIQKQMRQLQQRLEELEKRHKEVLDRLGDEPDKQESQEQEKSAQPKKEKDDQRV